MTSTPNSFTFDRERAFIGTPDKWPAWPRLPMTRRVPGENKQLGIMLDTRPAVESTRVYLVNLFAKLDATSPFIQYKSIDELLADGWRVD